MKKILLDFGTLQLKAELFDTAIAEKFYACLPITISLTKWGGELYGGINRSLGAEAPVPEIPEGGLAYSTNGDYLCIFFGQTPAWPVEFIGKIEGDGWKALQKGSYTRVNITSF